MTNVQRVSRPVENGVNGVGSSDEVVTVTVEGGILRVVSFRGREVSTWGFIDVKDVDAGSRESGPQESGPQLEEQPRPLATLLDSLGFAHPKHIVIADMLEGLPNPDDLPNRSGRKQRNKKKSPSKLEMEETLDRQINTLIDSHGLKVSSYSVIEALAVSIGESNAILLHLRPGKIDAAIVKDRVISRTESAALSSEAMPRSYIAWEVAQVVGQLLDSAGAGADEGDVPLPIIITGQMGEDDKLVSSIQQLVPKEIISFKPSLYFPDHFSPQEYASNIALYLLHSASVTHVEREVEVRGDDEQISELTTSSSLSALATPLSALYAELIGPPIKKWRKWSRQWRSFIYMVRRFSPYLVRQAMPLLSAILLAIATTAITLVEPWPMKLVLDNVLLGRELPSFLVPALGWAASGPLKLLYVLVGAVVAIAFVGGIINYYRELVTSFIGQRVAHAVRSDLYSHIQHLSFDFHERRHTGDVIMRLTSDVRILRNSLVSLPFAVFEDIVLMISVTTVMLLVDWQLSLMALSVFPGLLLSGRMYQGPMKSAIRKQREHEGNLATTAMVVLGAFKVVQGYTAERRETERFSAQNKRSLRTGLRASRLEARFSWAVRVVIALTTALVLIFAVRSVLSGALTPGDLILFTFYMRILYRPLRRVSRLMERAARGTAAGERILQMLKTQPSVQEAAGAIYAPKFQGNIGFEGVSLSYDKENLVLRDINLEIHKGERVAIVGQTGSGKSSLVSLVPRFYEPTAGRVLIDGRDVKEYTLSSLRKRISFVFQEPILLGPSIADDIAYGRPSATPEEIVQAAEQAGIHHIIASLPNGYETNLGERGGTLSGGQRQCISIARAIIKNAPIVILDEPTSGLDSESASMVMEALARLMEGRTVLMITHQLSTLKFVDRIVVLSDGRIVEQGTHSELIEMQGLYSAYLRLQTSELRQ